MNFLNDFEKSEIKFLLTIQKNLEFIFRKCRISKNLTEILEFFEKDSFIKNFKKMY